MPLKIFFYGPKCFFVYSLYSIIYLLQLQIKPLIRLLIVSLCIGLLTCYPTLSSQALSRYAQIRQMLYLLLLPIRKPTITESISHFSWKSETGPYWNYIRITLFCFLPGLSRSSHSNTSACSRFLKK